MDSMQKLKDLLETGILTAALYFQKIKVFFIF